MSDAASALRRLLDRVDEPRALTIRPEAAALVHRAADRLAAQLAGAADDVLLVALAGGSGVGKSTLINALAGATIAEAAEQRPCTMQPTVYHHRAVPAGGLPPELAAAARLIPHDRPELRFKVIVDTPDLDTFATSNRAATRALLKAAGLVVYVFSPEKYWEERAWSVIRDERRFSASVAVLNKADLAAPAELEKAADEIRRRFADLGCPSMPILRVCAARHVPRDDGTLPPTAAIDEFPSLRAQIETEWRDGDIARLRRDQRLRVLDHLEDAVTAAVPDDLTARLDALDAVAVSSADAEAARLAATLQPALAAAELDLRPQARLRQHRRFFGPFRAWLALGDLVTITLPRLARRVRGLGGGPATDLEDLLAGAPAEALERSVQSWSDRLRDHLYATGLPIDRWRRDAASPPVDILLADLAREIRARHGLLDAAPSRRLRLVADAASVLGWAIPMLLSAYALWSLVARMLRGDIAGGFDLLALVITVTVLAFTLLHGLTALALAGLGPGTADVGRQSVAAVLRRHLGRALAAYREAIDSDIDEIRRPLAALRALALSPTPVPALPETLPPSPRTERATNPPPQRREGVAPAEPLPPSPRWEEATSPPPPPQPSPTPSPPVEVPREAASFDPAPPEPPAPAECIPLPPPALPEDCRPEEASPPPSLAPEPIPDRAAFPPLSPAEIFRQAVRRRAPRGS